MRRDLPAVGKRNVRLPHLLDGNLRASIAALNVGKGRLFETIDRYGEGTINGVFAQMAEDTETLLRERLLEEPDR